MQDLLARSQHLEHSLMVLCSEKGHLEAEFAKMPVHSGRNIKDRNRKVVVEERLEVLNKEISTVRRQLKQVQGK